MGARLSFSLKHGEGCTDCANASGREDGDDAPMPFSEWVPAESDPEFTNLSIDEASIAAQYGCMSELIQALPHHTGGHSLLANSLVHQRPVCASAPSASSASGCSGVGQTFRTFLSYRKEVRALEARFLKRQLETTVGSGLEVMDTADFASTRLALCRIIDADCIAVILSGDTLTNPRCILELCTAIDAAVPIVAVNISGTGYDAVDAHRLLTFLDLELELRNRGASNVLLAHGLQVQDAAFMLSSVIPKIVGVEVDFAASAQTLKGSIADLADKVLTSTPVLISESRLDWLESRGELSRSPIDLSL